jgi:broad specificity phosphatase PhoE
VRLLLARHGQSVWNEVKKFQGSTDVELSALGRAQAAALGQALRGHRLAACYVSPMHRAVETAQIALAEARQAVAGGPGSAGDPPSAGGVWGAMSGPPTPISELRELCLGEWEGCTVEEIKSRAGDPYAQWVSAPLDCPPPGGEPLPDVCERVRRAVDRIVAAHEPGDDVLVVAHGGVISVYACWLMGASFNRLWRLRVDNASLTIVKPPRLVSLNDTSHLTGDLAPAQLVRGKYVTEALARETLARETTAAAPPGTPAP